MRADAVLAVDSYGLQAAALGPEGHGALQPQLKLCEGAEGIVLTPELQTRGPFAKLRNMMSTKHADVYSQCHQHKKTCMHASRANVQSIWITNLALP